MKPSVLITGCSSGIGENAARHLHACGWKVIATCRRAEDVSRLRDEGLTSLQLDYDEPASFPAILEQTLEETGGVLHGVYHNGASAIPGALEDVPAEAMQAIFQTNFLGWHALNLQIIPIMRAQGHGRIVMCSSVLGFVATPWRGAYVATKFALEGYADTLRLEMRDAPIHISLVQPGPITSRFRVNATTNFEHWIDWESSARASQYRDSLLQRLYKSPGKDRYELPPEAVTKCVQHALEAPRPKARYRITTPTRVVAAARRLLPVGVLDRILAKS